MRPRWLVNFSPENELGNFFCIFSRRAGAVRRKDKFLLMSRAFVSKLLLDLWHADLAVILSILVSFSLNHDMFEPRETCNRLSHRNRMRQLYFSRSFVSSREVQVENILLSLLWLRISSNSKNIRFASVELENVKVFSARPPQNPKHRLTTEHLSKTETPLPLRRVRVPLFSHLWTVRGSCSANCW